MSGGLLASEAKPAPAPTPGAAGAAASQKKPAVAPTLIVFNIIPEKGVEKGSVNVLTEIVLDTVSKSGDYTVMGQKDLDKLLSWEQSKQLQGCSDSSCLVAIAGAMGASYYIEGSLGAMGNKYVLTLKYMDATKVVILGRATNILENDEELLVREIPIMVRQIIPGLAARQLEAGLSPAALRVLRIAGWSAVGTGVAFGITGAFMLKSSSDIEDRIGKTPHPGDEVSRMIDEHDLKTALAWTGFGIAAAGIGAGVTMLLWPEIASKGSAQTGGLDVVVGPSIVTAQLRF
jgi:hypothetical protein